MSNIWILATEPGETAVLTEILGDEAAAAQVLAIGSRNVAEDAAASGLSVAWIDAAPPLENYAKAAADYLASEEADTVIGYATPAVRAALGTLADSSDKPVISNVISVSAEGDRLSVDHTIVDNRSIETLDVPASTCLLVNPLGFQAEETVISAAQGTIEQIDAQPEANFELVATEPVPPSGVETADYVVGVGRGASSPASFALAQQLADALGAELSGSMPGVRDYGNFPEDAVYVGLSGATLSAKIYFALGISGSTPHLIGIGNAKRVVCINNDENARLFDHADYGIVGNVDEVVPEIINALKA